VAAEEMRRLVLLAQVEPIQVMVEAMVAMERKTHKFHHRFQALLVVAVAGQVGTVVTAVAPHLMAATLEVVAEEAVVVLTTDITEITAVA
jgi:pantothenate kinase